MSAPMSYESERLRILELIENGIISASQGIELLEALSGKTGEEDLFLSEDTPGLEHTSVESSPLEGFAATSAVVANQGIPLDAAPLSAESPAEEDVPIPSIPDAEGSRWRRWWLIPIWIGATITTLGGLLMFWAYQSSGLGFWFACAWFPFLLGVLVLALAWAARDARWLHLRIHQPGEKRPQKIAISLPLPLRLTAWFLRTFRHHIPKLDNTGLDEVIMALETTSAEAPFYLKVDEGESGEQVEIYIG